MSIKKFVCAALLSVAVGFSFIGCGSSERNPATTNKTPSVSGGDITDNNDVEIGEPDSTEHDFTLVSQNGGTYTFKCSDCDQSETVTISCESGTQNAYTVENGVITFKNITEKSVYDIRGTFHGSIAIDVGDDNKLELQMSGFELSSHKTAPITVLSGDKVTLSAKKSTENAVNDLRAAVDQNSISASVYAECDLDIQGKGSLNIKSVNNNGVHTKKDLNVKNLSLQVDCRDNALKGNDSVTVESGNVVLIARQGDGIKTTDSDVSSKGIQRGTVEICGGDVLIYAACDGIDAAYDAVINESSAATTLQIFTDKYSKYSEEVTAVADSVYYVRFNSAAYKYSLKFYNDDDDFVWQNSSSATTVGGYRYYPITKPSGYGYVKLYIYDSSQSQGQDENYLACTDGMTVNSSYDTIALQSRGNSLTYSWTNYTTNQNGGPGGFGPGGFGGMNDGNTDKGDYSTKGIKADNRVEISAGNITVSAYDDAVHANNAAALENGETPLGNVVISGGEIILRSNDDGIHADGKAAITGGNVAVVGSYEGIEGSSVEISGGDISVVSTDDGVNGAASSGTVITISGGKLYVYAGGDGVDSNSAAAYAGILFSGGKSVIISTGQADSSIDSERGYKYTGGHVVAIGRSGGMGNESVNCQNFSSVGTSKSIQLQKDAYLTVSDIATVKMPLQMNALVVCLGKTNASISSSSSSGGSFDGNGVCWIV